MNENNNEENLTATSNEVTESKEASKEENKVIISEPPYNGWLISNSFLKRSLAVVGHYLVGALITIVPVTLLLSYLTN